MSNSTARVLRVTEARLRRLAKKRARQDVKKGYREAATLVHRLIR